MVGFFARSGLLTLSNKVKTINNMEIKINYTELQDYILSKFGKKVELSYANFSTVKVSTKVSVLGFSKTVGIDLAFEKIEDTVLYVSYGGALGIELLVSPAISFLKHLVPEQADFVEETAGHKLAINLAMLDELKNVLDKVELREIRFDETSINIVAKLK